MTNTFSNYILVELMHAIVYQLLIYLMFLSSDEKLWKTQKHYMHFKDYFKVHHKQGNSTAIDLNPVYLLYYM